MKPHLSYVNDASEEFQSPDGNWLFIYRAIVYDGWLSWKDALPDDPVQRARLDRMTYQSIESLAKAIHLVHQLMPGFRGSTNSPFEVRRWWDPDDEEALWRDGRACLAKLNGYTTKEFQRSVPSKSRLVTRCLTDAWIEFTLPKLDAATTSERAAQCSSPCVANEAEPTASQLVT